jgi:nitroreductase
MPQSGYIYIVHGVGTNFIKMGKTTNFPKRFQALQQVSPFPLRILSVQCVFDMDKEEKHLLIRYGAYRTRGEWAAVPEDVLAQWPPADQPIETYTGTSNPRQKLNRAQIDAWIQEALKHEPVAAMLMAAEAEALGITPKMLRRARERLHIHTSKRGTYWYWQLPATPLTHDHTKGPYDAL